MATHTSRTRLTPSDQTVSEQSHTSEADDSRIDRLMKYVRIGLLIFGLIVSVVGYLYIIDLADPRGNFNAFDDLRRLGWTEDYQFFSGSKGGFYIRIGTELERRTESKSPRLQNVSTSGALENARRVASTANSFGLVQEDTLSSADFMREHVRYITPLYLERMHIIYDTQALLDFREKEAQEGSEGPAASNAKLGGDELNLTLSRNGFENEVQRFFKSARVSTGPVGSGSRVFARYLLTHCGITDYRELGLPFSQARSRLKASGDQKVDVVFTIAGAPLDSVAELLGSTSDRRFRLMSIDHAVIPALNEEFDLQLNRTNFQGKYPNANSVTTFGSWSFLIASRDVSDVAIAATLAELHECKDEIRREMKIEDKDIFQLSEFNFYETYRIGQTGAWLRVLRNLLFLVLFLSCTTTAVFVSCSWFISSYNKVRYYRELTGVNERSLEDNWLLDWPDEGEERFPEPIILEDQKEIISKLIKGISEHSGLAVLIRQAYNNGGLMSAHRRQLLGAVDDLRSVCQRHLARRLNEYYSNYGEYEATTLRHFFTAGYLTSEDYQKLNNRYGVQYSTQEIGKTTANGSCSITESWNVRDDANVELVRPAPRIFISYRRSDSTFAVGRMRERLIASFGRDKVFQDIDIPAGRDFREYITNEVSSCDILLAVIGSEWDTIMHERERHGDNDYYRTEIEVALNCETATVIPVLLAPAELPYDEQIPPSIRPMRYLQSVIVRPDPEFQQSMKLLIKAIMDAFQGSGRIENNQTSD